MAKAITYIALYAIGKHAAGAKLELDPEGPEAKRLLNAKAIATREELAKMNPHAQTSEQDDAKVAELEKALEDREAAFKESEEERIALAEKLKAADEQTKAAEAKVAELEKALEEASKPANGKAAK